MLGKGLLADNHAFLLMFVQCCWKMHKAGGRQGFGTMLLDALLLALETSDMAAAGHLCFVGLSHPFLDFVFIKRSGGLSSLVHCTLC